MLVTVTNKGQVTVPKEIRDRLGVGPGSKLDFQLEPGGTMRVRVLARGAAGLFGLLHDDKRVASTVEQMNEPVGRHLAAKARR